MGLVAALFWWPDFRFQALQVVETKEQLNVNTDYETVEEYESPVTVEDVLVDYENKYTFPEETTVFVKAGVINETFSMKSFMAYYTLKLAALDVDFKGGELGDEPDFELDEQPNPYEEDRVEPPWNPPI